MSDYVGVVTNIGQAKIAAAIGGTALNLTTIRVGDGNGAPITPNPAMIDLVHRVGAAYPIISSGRDPVNANHWRVTALVPVADGPFDVREIGVWDAAGDMIAVANHVLVQKRTPAQGAAVELLTDIVFPVSETAQVTVLVTPSVQISIFQMLRAGFMVVESATLADPPGAPALGRTHVVPAGATGAWVGLAGYLVQWNGIVWVAVNPPVGFHVVDQSKGVDTGARWLERTATGWEPGLSRLIQHQPGNYVAAGGTANALTVTLDPAPASNAALIGTPIRLLIAATNTGPANLSANGFGALPIKLQGGAALSGGEMIAGDVVTLIPTGASYQIQQSATLKLAPYLQFVPGTYSITVPAGATSADVWLWGGGGGGGGVGSTSNGSGSGGGGGGFARKTITGLTPGSTITLIVGAGGAAGLVGGAGGSGGSSSFGAYFSATGGGGGSANGGGMSGAGGSGLGGDINVAGGGGVAGLGAGGVGAGGAGGGASMGGQGGGGAPGIAGAGTSPGGGGGGSGSYTTNTGAAGAPGACIIYWK